jgi:hypothetical protein
MSGSSSSSLAERRSSADAFIDISIKYLKEGECRDKIDAWAAACAGQEPPPDDNEACASARLALMKCVVDAEAAIRNKEEQQGKSS